MRFGECSYMSSWENDIECTWRLSCGCFSGRIVYSPVYYKNKSHGTMRCDILVQARLHAATGLSKPLFLRTQSLNSAFYFGRLKGAFKINAGTV